MSQKLLVLLLMVFAAGPAFSKEGESIGGNIKMWIVKSTFGSFKEEDEKALIKMAVSGDTEGILALVKQGRSIVLDRGIKGLVLSEDKINDLYQVLLDPTPTPGIRVWAPRNFLWSAGASEVNPINLPSEEEVADVAPRIPFDVASLPRVPIHFPARRLSDEECTKLTIETEGNPQLTAWCWCNRISQTAEQAIREMMHLPPDRSAVIAPYVVYGPIPDAHNAADTNPRYNTWLVEIQFSLEGDKKIYTAVVDGGRSGVVSCELGEDRPTLRADAAPTVKAQSAPASTSAWLAGMKEADKRSKQQDKPILIYFSALNWDPYSVQMENEVLTQPAFQQFASRNLILVHFNFPIAHTTNAGCSLEGTDLFDHYHTQTFPTFVLVRPTDTGDYSEGGFRTVELSRAVGYLTEEQFLAWLKDNTKDREAAPPETAIPANQSGEQAPIVQDGAQSSIVQEGAPAPMVQDGAPASVVQDGAQASDVQAGAQGENHDFLRWVITAMANYDWRALTTHMVDSQVNYFGHRHAYLSYIISDIRNDSRQFGKQNLTCYWDTFKHEVSGEMFYDSVNVYAVIEEHGGRVHRAMERVTVGYTSGNGQTIYSLTLKVLH